MVFVRFAPIGLPPFYLRARRVLRTPIGWQEGMKAERDPLELDEALVFDFGGPRSVRVTMVGVEHPLDALFVRKNRLLTVTPCLEPGIDLVPFPSADMLVELRCGASAHYGIEPDRIEWITLVRANGRR